MRAIILGTSLSVLVAGAASAQAIELQFDPRQFSSPEAAQAYVERSAMGARIEILDLDLNAGIIRLDGSAAAAQHFSADPAFHRVIGQRQPTPARQFELHLSSETIFAERGGPVDLQPTRRTAWPGERLRVVALAEDGRILGEAFVPDPRFVRYEGWSADGRHVSGSNQSLIQDSPIPPLAVSLPAEASIIEVFDQAGSRFAPQDGRLLGRIRADQIVEAGQ